VLNIVSLLEVHSQRLERRSLPELFVYDPVVIKRLFTVHQQQASLFRKWDDTHQQLRHAEVSNDVTAPRKFFELFTKSYEVFSCATFSSKSLLFSKLLLLFSALLRYSTLLKEV